MQTFIANARSNAYAGGDACNTCCCEPAYGKPGETNPWQILYGHWVASMSGPGLIGGTAFDITKISVVTPSGTNQPPVNHDYTFATRTDLPVGGSLAALPALAGGGLVYALVGLYGPANGIVTIDAGTGTFEYAPRPGFNGYDAFYFTTYDGINTPVKNKVDIAVSPVGVAAIPLPQKIPVVNVPRQKISITRDRIRFPLEISPAAIVGDRYRISIRQPASDCDGWYTYYHEFCADLTIGKC
jgi:hypothetical protein